MAILWSINHKLTRNFFGYWRQFRTKTRTNFQYPLRDLLNQVPEALHLRLKQSTYQATSPGRRTICIPVDGKSSSVEKESFACDSLHTIIHEAVSYVTPGKKFMRQGSKTLNEKVNALWVPPRFVLVFFGIGWEANGILGRKWWLRVEKSKGRWQQTSRKRSYVGKHGGLR